jgi:hypothetical protein
MKTLNKLPKFPLLTNCRSRNPVRFRGYGAAAFPHSTRV